MMRHRKLICFITAVIIIGSSGEPVLPQNKNVSVRGVVLDLSSHQPLANAVVQIPELDLITSADSKGIFEFSGVPAGKYSLNASYIGYKKYSEEIVLSEKNVVGVIIHLIPSPVQTSTIVVTGEHPNTRFDDLNEFTNVLKGKELDRDMGNTLAATLKNETGLAIRSMGPAPARPVIRGLGSDRVYISEDGFKTADLSASSPDHAVTIEPFTIERIEVIRGPKILLQNSTTLGGVVNIIRNEIPSTVPLKITGSAGIYVETINKGYLGAFNVSVPVSDFVIRGEFSRRSAGNMKTPIGELKNSDAHTLSFGGAAGFIKEWGFAGISLKEFDSEYGIPGGFIGGHPNGVDIKMFKRDISSKLMVNIRSSLIQNVELLLSRNYYKHIELEKSDLIGAEFSIYNYDAKININTRNIGPFVTGTIGLSSEYRDFKIGGFVFTPPSELYKYSAFLYQSLHLGSMSFDIAGRYNYDHMNPLEDARVKRTFNTYSLALSALYEFTPAVFFGGTVSRSSRVPTLEELYSEGPHLAAYSYDIGNQDLEDERGIGSELFFYNKSDRHFFNITLFRNYLSYYIIPRNTGSINFNTLLPVYQTSGIEALMYGLESQLDYRFTEHFEVSASASYTHGEITETGEPLPSIPPLKGLLELKYIFTDLLAGLSVEAVSEQNRTDIFEEATAGYIIPNFFLQYTIVIADAAANFSLNVDNIFNKEYRNHLSRLKSIIPEAGRNVRLTARVFI